LSANELVLTFRCSYVCANFGETRSRNVTVRVLADGHTHTHTQTQTDFIICPMLYAIAMGQIIIILSCLFDCWNAELPECRPIGLTTMSRCQVMVSRIARVGIAATYCRFQWSAFRPVVIKAATDCMRECRHTARSFSFGRSSSADRPDLATLAYVLYHLPKRSDRSDRSPTVEPGHDNFSRLSHLRKWRVMRRCTR